MPITASNAGKLLKVLQSSVENPHTSISRAAQEHRINSMSVKKVLQINLFHPLAIHLVHELNETDSDGQIEFRGIKVGRVNANPEFLYRVIFSDGATF